MRAPAESEANGRARAQLVSTPHPPDRVRRVPRRRTDCDVYFRKPVRLADWGSPLPSAVGLA